MLDRIGSEWSYLTSAVRMLRRVTPIARRRDHTFVHVIEERAAAHGERPALISDEETLTFAGLDARANRYARWARSRGIGKGDTVCLFRQNSPDFVAAWIGIARVGGASALVNTQLTGAALAHSVNIVRPKHAIVDAALAEAWRSAAPHIAAGLPVSVRGAAGANTEGVGEAMDAALDGFSGAPLAEGERVPLSLEDRCLYIYTSGTTGQPKAANINHYRVQAIAHGFSAAMAATEKDRIYVCLPLYHSAGGVLAIGSTLTVGGSAVIARRFSAGRFWDDVVGRDCTLFQYIGEMCRYLVNAPVHPLEGRHRVRLACGNGLRPDIWPAFQARFRIPRILEYYAATEGNAVIFNFDNREGSVGRIARWARHRFPMRLVRYDMERDEPVRGADGLCIPCRPGEVGELISEILDDPLKPAQRFEGYADKAATERKILKDAFRPGDRWFRTGDLMRQDDRGYYFFVDRMGDTFRWKGENVATLQISETLTACPGVAEAAVYGVAVPGHEGRAGMAAVVAEAGFDPLRFHDHCRAHLPTYARPIFLRLVPELETTGTFKQRKVRLAEEGFDPAIVRDPLYIADPETGTYRPLDAALHADIVSGRVRL